MGKKSSSNGFLAQAGILAIAGIISRIIGLLYKSPLQAVIGSAGMGCYSQAHEFYAIVLMISSYSIPAAMSKVIAQKLGAKEYKNAHKLFKCGLIYVLIVGAVASVLLFACAGLLVNTSTVPVLRFMAPAIFIYGILGVLRGYFQAHKSMAQTSVSQILEQIAVAVVSIAAGSIFIKKTFPDGINTEVEEELLLKGVKGAEGAALGVDIGVLVGLIFIFLIYLLNRKYFHRQVNHDRTDSEMTYPEVFKELFMTVTPFIISTAVYHLSNVANAKLFSSLYPMASGAGEYETNSVWGLFAGEALTISNIPLAFASAMAAAALPMLAQYVAKREIDSVCEKIALSVKVTMLIAIPCAVGLFALAKPIVGFLFFRNTDAEMTLAGYFLMAIAPTVIFYALSTLNSQILQGIGKLFSPIVNAAISIVVQCAVTVPLLLFTKLGGFACAIGITVYSLLMCILNQLAVRKAIGYRQEITNSFIIPLLSSGFMGVAAFLVYEGMYLITHSIRISVIPAIIVAVPVYFVFILLLKGVTEAELRSIPKGHILVKIAKKCRLM